MEVGPVRSPAAGVGPRSQRDHNERLVLSLLARHDALPASELSRMTALSAQTVSVILRGLEGDGLVRRDDPQRGRVGKPRVPIRLDPGGAFSIGLKIGRRSAELVLMQLDGGVGLRREISYPWPEPGRVLDFLADGLGAARSRIGARAAARIAGIGVAMPGRLWEWPDSLDAPPGALEPWRGLDVAGAVAARTGLPVLLENDGTAACRAEHVLGRGREFRDFAYFFVGGFAGGGVVLDHSVFAGATGNAGAFGSLPLGGRDGRDGQLVDAVSLFALDAALERAGHAKGIVWTAGSDWDRFEPELSPWIARTAEALARAAVTVCAVIDFEAVVIDGAFPAGVRARLVEGVRKALDRMDRRGLSPVRVEEGRVGAAARALGAATAPIFARYLLNTHGEGDGAPLA